MRSANLPFHLFPDGFLEKNTISPRRTWIVEADDAAVKATIEDKMMQETPIDLSNFMIYNNMTQWACIVPKENFSIYGELQRKKIESIEHPEHFHTLLEQLHPTSSEIWDLIEQHDASESASFVVLFTKDEAWLCLDNTFYYQSLYPTGKIKSVMNIFVLDKRHIF